MSCVAGTCTLSRTCDAGPSDTQTVETSDAPADQETDSSVASLLPSALDGLVLWLDSADTVTSTSGFVWPDRSSLHNDAIAPSGAEPTLEEPWAGLPHAVRFSGIGQYLVLPSGMSDFTRGLSVFVVAEPWARAFVNDTDAARFIDFAATARQENDSILFCRYGSEGSELLYQVYIGDKVKSHVPARDAIGNYTRHLFEVVAPGGLPQEDIVTRYFKDGASLSPGESQVPLVVDRTSNLIGRSNYPRMSGQNPDPDYRGFLAEIVLYNRALSDDERRAVEAYLLARWRLP
jgi:hypothetical protein